MATITKFSEPRFLGPSATSSRSEITAECLFIKEAVDAWEGEGGALRRSGWRFLNASADGEKLMTGKINMTTILTEEGAESSQFASEPHLNSRKPVEDSDGCGRNQRIRKAGRSFFYTVARPRTLWSLFLYLVAIVALASAETRRTVPTVETIVARMAQARAENQARFRPYLVTRDYKLFGKEADKTKSQMTAAINFVPPDFIKYAIQQTSGSGMGERIVRRMLEKEAEVVKDYGSTDISPYNYDFRFLREEEVSGQGCYVLELLPRRRDKNLLRGHIWVDANTYLLHRTEGEPAKRPSWWLRDVRIALLYNDVDGMWLQTALEATATVQILGPYRMVSRDLKYEISERIAAGPSATSFRTIYPIPRDPDLLK
jgi:hypothetical protein